MKPYSNKDSKKEQVRFMFDNIAHRYDFLNRLLSMGIDQSWRRRVVRMARHDHPRQVLDMATGTADLAIMLAKGCPEAQVTGVDLSARMLEIGRIKISRQGLCSRIDLTQGDAEKTGYGHNYFDLATVAFGVRNFEDREAGLRGLLRSLKPGGRLLILEFGMPQFRPLRTCYMLYFNRILPWLGGAVSKNSAAYTYLPQSVTEFPYGDRFIEELHHIGFRNGSYKNLSCGVAQIYSVQKPE